LVKAYPTNAVYIDLCPEEFSRPSFLIELIKVDRQQVNYKTIKEIDYFTITCFDIVDNYTNSDTINVLTIQQAVLDLLRAGYITVDDRAIKVKASIGGRDFDQAFVDLQFEYNEVVSDAADTTPMITEVIATVKGE
jgi:hypothetical protein